MNGTPQSTINHMVTRFKNERNLDAPCDVRTLGSYVSTPNLFPELRVGARGGWSSDTQCLGGVIRSFKDPTMLLYADNLLAKQNSRKHMFSPGNYTSSIDDYNEQWQTLDDYLYRLCRENPTHDCKLSVNAKVYIIGRTYETQIERHVPSKGTQASSISQVADLFFKHCKELDRFFLRLKGLSGPLSVANMTEILEIHGSIVRMLHEITRQNVNGEKISPRSFVSKYMHFHNPIVPLYDGNAKTVLQSLVPSIPSYQVSIPGSTDSDYVAYVRRFLSLYQSIASQNPAVSVRSLDYYLVWSHDNPDPNGSNG